MAHLSHLLIRASLPLLTKVSIFDKIKCPVMGKFCVLLTKGGATVRSLNFQGGSDEKNYYYGVGARICVQ